MRKLIFLSACFVFVSQDATHCSAQEAPSALSGFDASEIFDVQDNQTLTADDDILLRLLYRACLVSDSSMMKYSTFTEGVESDEIRAQPRDFRFYVFELNGRVQRIWRFETSGNDEDDVFGGFCLARIVVDDGSEIVVATPEIRDQDRAPSIPRRWKANEKLNETVRFSGFFMAARDLDPDDAETNTIKDLTGLKDSNPLVFVAKRLEWFPDSSGANQLATDTERLLAKHGVDIGRLETVRSNVRGNISENETASFYQLLAATRKLERVDFPIQISDFTVCLREPRENIANAIVVVGNVRRATRIMINDQQVKQSLGMDHYFQLDLLIPLEHQKIVIKPPPSTEISKSDETDYIVHENRFPVSVCVNSLPCSESEILKRQVAIPGFFFKLWNYESELSRQKGTHARQIVPLIIGLDPQVVEIPPDYFSYLLALLGLLFLAGFGGLVWYLNSGGGSSKKENRSLPERIELPESDTI